jgi:hypothetical protein
LVAQLQFHERLVVTLALQQRVVVQLVQVLQPVVQVQQLVLVQRVQQLFVAPLELVEHPCLQKKLMLQKKLQEFLAY